MPIRRASGSGPFNVKKFSERSFNKKNISKKRRTRSLQSGSCPRQLLLAGVGVEGLRQERNTRRIEVTTERNSNQKYIRKRRLNSSSC